MEDKEPDLHKSFTHFSKEDLLRIFPLDSLQYMYKVYIDENTALPNDIIALANLLANRVPKSVGQCLFCNKGDLVLDLDGNILRILKVDYIDERLGPMLLVYNPLTDEKYPTTSFLIRIPEFTFADEVIPAVRAGLIVKGKRNNFVVIQKEIFRLGEIHITDNKMAKNILKLGHFSYLLPSGKDEGEE